MCETFSNDFYYSTDMAHRQGTSCLCDILCVIFLTVLMSIQVYIPFLFQPTSMRLHRVVSGPLSPLCPHHFSSSPYVLCSSYSGLLQVPVPQAWKVMRLCTCSFPSFLSDLYSNITFSWKNSPITYLKSLLLLCSYSLPLY